MRHASYTFVLLNSGQACSIIILNGSVLENWKLQTAKEAEPSYAGTPKLDRQMFGLMWGPTVAAVSVVLDHAEDPAVVRQALDGLLLAAKIAAFHHVDEVMDSLVVSLSKFTAALDPAAPKPAACFWRE